MKTHARFCELPLTAIEPEGWLRCYLEKQRDGLTGHLDEIGYPFSTVGWAGPKIEIGLRGPGWEPYEQTAYWFDGMIRCGHLLGDEFLIAKAKKQIDYVLEHADADGYLGPEFLKEPSFWCRWPHALFARALRAHYSATGEERILSALADHYLSNTSTHSASGRRDYAPGMSDARNVCNIEAILWTYERVGDERLLDHAIQAYDEYNRLLPDDDTTLRNLLSDKRATEHGVTYNEIGKLGAILYMYTGEEEYLDATVNAYRKLDRDQMLVDGVCSSTERLRGKDPLDGHETCDIADYSWGVGYLLLATGEAEYADKIERACLNAGPGAVRSDFKAHQYFSYPNQVIADATSDLSPIARGSKLMSYRPICATECCTGEINRVMPNYVARMWLGDGNNGLVAALYGPSRVRARVGREQQEVTIVEETGYPFSDRIDFGIRTAAPVEFRLSLRIPNWCRNPQVLYNGQPLEHTMEPGSFVGIARRFLHNDRITLILPMDIRISHWPGGGISVERGPLAYALRIEEDWRIEEQEPKSTAEFPAWNLYAASPWNYALALDEREPERDVEVIQGPLSPEPWSIHTAPIELRVPARRVSGWVIEEKESVTRRSSRGVVKEIEGKFALTPQLPDPDTLDQRLAKKVEMITLVPYGCAKLRITIFPHCRPT